MQTDPSEAFLDRLAADLGPVTPRRPGREAALIGVLILAEMAFFLTIRGAPPEMPAVMVTPAFWWKSASFALLASLAAAAMLVSLDPSLTLRRPALGRALAIAVPLALAAGWLIDAGSSARSGLLARLEWRDGLDCLGSIALLSLPLVLAFGIIMRRGAATRPVHTAAAAGLAAAGFGAFVFAFHCPHVDPLYITVWYGGAVAAIAALARLLLPPLTRW